MAAPKGVSEKKFKSCKQKVQAKGMSLSRAFAICTASLKGK